MAHGPHLMRRLREYCTKHKLDPDTIGAASKVKPGRTPLKIRGDSTLENMLKDAGLILVQKDPTQ